MHPEAREFVRMVLFGLSRPPKRILEIGGRDINGSVRDLFPAAETYVSIDLQPGPGVDVVADGATYEPNFVPDLVLCLEVLEHAASPRAIVRHALNLLPVGGTLVLTCAGPGRAPHSGIDGGPLRPGEHYANIDPYMLAAWASAPELGARVSCSFVLDHRLHDVRCAMTKLEGWG